MEEGRVIKVSGPLVIAEGLTNSKMYDLVYVGEQRLMGEIIELRRGLASIQVYEETDGLGPEDPVFASGEPLSVELGPGLLTAIFDGVQRPLDKILDIAGEYITRGIQVNNLDREKEWNFHPQVKKDQKVSTGDILGTVQETVIIEHKIMVPPGLSGKLKEINSGKMKITDTVAVLGTEDGDKEITMLQHWPIRKARPIVNKLVSSEPLNTGQRVIDTFFPIVKGGTACVPGPFGSGKTVIQHQIAKWADAEIIVFIGCGERGNEMTDVLIEFPELTDPHTGESLMTRTVLIANTSNMPVAAREASIYTGITIAEYYRDMGYDVALQADSTSRWAEALREISGRLEEMPGEEGYPAYLSTRLAAFYERAGRVKCLSSNERTGSLSVIGSVSPPGGDLSEPVVQATLRIVKVFWGLEDRLAYERHFPAINWLISYSLYSDKFEDYLNEKIDPEFKKLRDECMALLQREAELLEIVRLVGIEALSMRERVILETAKSIREDFLQQNAFHELDTYSSLEKQFNIIKAIIAFHRLALQYVEEGAKIEKIFSLSVRDEIARAKYLPEDKPKEFEKLMDKIEDQMKKTVQVGG